jgi:predicted KAP-like P-loop ATPase
MGTADDQRTSFGQPSPDQAARTRSEDRLGRVTFAEAIGRIVAEWTSPESLVISLTGPWGSGKTSIKNFMIDAFSDIPEDRRPDVLEFEPWQISGSQQLSTTFMHDVGVKLGRRDKIALNRDIARRWKKLAAALRLTESLVSVLPSRATLAPLLLGAVLLTMSRFLTNAWSSWLFWAGVTSSIGGALLGTSAKASEAMATAFTTFAEDDRTIDELRRELRQDLLKRDRPLLIVIDDIDRLNSDEIRLIMQLVRAVSDFPRLIFLLLFARAAVETAVSELGGSSGAEYLEKIIQVPFEVPGTDRNRLRDVFIKEVNAILADLPDTPKVDERRWWNLYVSGADAYIQDLRDVSRFVNGFRFHAALLRGTAVMEVNPVDLLGLEFIRCFEKDLYAAMPDNRRILLRGPEQSYGGRDRREEARADFDQLIKIAKNPAAATRILVQLFQPVQWLLEGYSFSSGFEAGWERELRICSPEIFHRYFLLTVPASDISASETHELVGETVNAARLSEHLSELAKHGQLNAAVDKLRLSETSITAGRVPNVIRALFDVGDLIPERAPVTGLPAVWFISGFIRALLKKILNPAERARVLLDAMRDSSGTYLPVDVVGSLTRDEEKGDAEQLIADDSLSLVRAQALTKIRSVAADGQLVNHPQIKYLLSAWESLGGSDEVRAWSAAIVSNVDSVKSILPALMSHVRSHGMGDAVAKTTVEARIDEIEKYMPLADLERTVDSITVDDLPASEKVAVKAFQRAMRARREGKPTGMFSALDRDDDEEGG